MKSSSIRNEMYSNLLQTFRKLKTYIKGERMDLLKIMCHLLFPFSTSCYLPILTEHFQHIVYLRAKGHLVSSQFNGKAALYSDLHKTDVTIG